MPAVSDSMHAIELDFERPLAALEQQIAQIESQGAESDLDMSAELGELRRTHANMLEKIYGNLTAWQTVRVARHPARPQSVDYIKQFVRDFCELHGDRRFGDDQAIMTGFGRIASHKVMWIAHRKGKDTPQRVACNFGCAHPEGYRKALRAMKLAEKFGVPVVSLVDTPGAYPGIGAEERGQAEAIAVNLREMSRLRTPILSVVIGEGGSGGALGLAVADRVAMMENAWYSVISPEGCAAILWKSGEKAQQAAEALKLRARDNLKLRTVDAVIDEPLGGAHRDPIKAGQNLQQWIDQNLSDLRQLAIDALLEKRWHRWRRMGNE